MLDSFISLIDGSLQQESYESAINLLQRLTTKSSCPPIHHLHRLTSCIIEPNDNISPNIRHMAYRYLCLCLHLHGPKAFKPLWTNSDTPPTREMIVNENGQLDYIPSGPITIWDMYSNIWECLADCIEHIRKYPISDSLPYLLLLRHFIHLMVTDVKSRSKDLNSSMLLQYISNTTVFNYARTKIEEPLSVAFACIVSAPDITINDNGLDSNHNYNTSTEIVSLGQDLLYAMFLLSQPNNPPIDEATLFREISLYHERLSTFQSIVFFQTIKDSSFKYYILEEILCINIEPTSHVLPFPRFNDLLRDLKYHTPNYAKISSFEYVISIFHIIESSLRLEIEYFGLQTMKKDRRFNIAQELAETWINVLESIQIYPIIEYKNISSDVIIVKNERELISHVKEFLQTIPKDEKKPIFTSSSSSPSKFLSPSKYRTPLKLRQLDIQNVIHTSPNSMNNKRPRRQVVVAQSSRKQGIVKDKYWWIYPQSNMKRKQKDGDILDEEEKSEIILLDLSIMMWIDALCS